MTTEPDGLLVQLGNQKKLFLANDILLHDVQAALPVLERVRTSGVQAPAWRQRVEKDDPSLQLFETSSHWSTSGAYAVVLQLELKCHLNEVCNALFTDDVATYEATMRGQFGKKFRNGAILHRFADATSAAPTHVLVKTATFANSIAKDVAFHFTELRARDIAARTVTRVAKSLPKEFHDRLANSSSVLGGAKDVLAYTHATYSGPGKTTLFFYATCSVDDETQCAKRLGTNNSSSAMERPIAFVVALAKSMASLDAIIRRRRLGYQTFIVPSAKATAQLPKTCHRCAKTLHVLLRGDHYCQLCGHRACSACSNVVDVEIAPSVVTTRRVCLICIGLVDKCVFDDLALDCLGSPVVAEIVPQLTFYQRQAAAQRSSSQHRSGSSSSSRDTSRSDENGSSNSSTDDDQKAMEYLFSIDPLKQAQALDQLGVSRLLVDARAGAASADEPLPSVSYATFDAIVRRRLARPVRLAVADCVVAEADNRRHYLLSFEEGLELSEVPQAVDNESIRRDMIHQIGFLQPTFAPRDALTIVCEIAAKVLDCRTAFVSVVTSDLQYAIAPVNLHTTLQKLPRRETMCAYALTTDAPFIVRNAMRDVRFRAFFCVARAGVRFYASFPIEAPLPLGGGIVAALVVMDKEPKPCVTNRQFARMRALTDIVSELLSTLPRQ